MEISRRLIDRLTLGSTRPLRRLAAYYLVLAIVATVVFRFAPGAASLFAGDRLTELISAPVLLKDGLETADGGDPMVADFITGLGVALNTCAILLSTLALMLPVTWVYISTAPERKHNQSLVQALIVLPMVVAAIVLVVQDSLALAFSLAGVVAAVRFRTPLNEPLDLLFVFLAIAVGLAAGAQLIVAAVCLSIIFNFMLLLVWRHDFGRNVIEPSASVELAAPPAQTPKRVAVLSHHPKYNAIVRITTTDIERAQRSCQKALEHATKRWKLDEVVTNKGKPSELHYLVRMRRSVPRDALLLEIQSYGDVDILSADVEVGDAVAVEHSEPHAPRKRDQAEALVQP